MTDFPTTVSDTFFARWCPNPTRIYDLGEIYAEFNARFFNGNLPVLRFQEFTDGEEVVRRSYPQLKWDGRMSRLWGNYKPNGRGSGLIKISKKAAFDPNQVRSTLLHEMVHAWLDMKHLDDGIKGHGENFILTAKRINEECESLGVNYRVNFYNVEVRKEEPEVHSELLQTTIFCGKDLDLARSMKAVLNAAFHTCYVYEQ